MSADNLILIAKLLNRTFAVKELTFPQFENLNYEKFMEDIYYDENVFSLLSNAFYKAVDLSHECNAEYGIRYIDFKDH